MQFKRQHGVSDKLNAWMAKQIPPIESLEMRVNGKAVRLLLTHVSMLDNKAVWVYSDGDMFTFMIALHPQPPKELLIQIGH